jgi:predicted nucleic-acid-binding protein
LEKFIIDTNIILRVIIDEGTELNEKTKAVLKKVHDGKIIFVLSDLVVLEAIWVLKSFYKIERAIIAKALKGFILSDGVEHSKNIIECLCDYEKTNLDIVDIYLANMSKHSDIKILTWDKGFMLANSEFYSPADL